ncbi:GNAT family N-acetyltransferase [Mucilaginibacter sp.]|uniref:GNAT family N-acetyltransferase n=1 Tax=Mucilaginibacter sp. TaxID=1882438 RepID=UPI002620E031|nr:GNAT family N-acetyltransferase [Mucilaginibacter sp.]MDB4926713.1 ribosomal-protein-alanine N-acetyltransferase [Mucilaginibacter sp.]
MFHVLDNPAYNALISGNKHLANGNKQVKYFDKEVSPFVGFKENTTNSFQLLYDLISHSSPVGFISPVEIDIPKQWKVANTIKCLQMIFDGEAPQEYNEVELIPLTNQHVSQMLALTKLTNPGPFGPQTIDFGHYKGVFDGDKLVAMAGQRMHPLPYAEISAVCTHPDYTGKGYAKQLLLHHINRIKAAGEIPMLHVRYDNERAIKVYESTGFVARKEIYFTIMHK